MQSREARECANIMLASNRKSPEGGLLKSFRTLYEFTKDLFDYRREEFVLLLHMKQSPFVIKSLDTIICPIEFKRNLVAIQLTVVHHHL